MLILPDKFVDKNRLISEMPIEHGKYFYYGANLNEFEYHDNNNVKNLVIRYNYPIYYNVYFQTKCVLENILGIELLSYYYKDTFARRKTIYEKVNKNEIVLFFNVNNDSKKIKLIEDTLKKEINIKNRCLLFFEDDFIIKSFSIFKLHQIKFAYMQK